MMMYISHFDDDEYDMNNLTYEEIKLEKKEEPKQEKPLDIFEEEKPINIFEEKNKPLNVFEEEKETKEIKKNKKIKKKDYKNLIKKK